MYLVAAVPSPLSSWTTVLHLPAFPPSRTGWGVGLAKVPARAFAGGGGVGGSPSSSSSPDQQKGGGIDHKIPEDSLPGKKSRFGGRFGPRNGARDGVGYPQGFRQGGGRRRRISGDRATNDT